jgi:hypothetical protein
MKCTPSNPSLEHRLPYEPAKGGDKLESPDDSPLNLSGAARAFGEVCPKHRKIRRENLRVRPILGGNGLDRAGQPFRRSRAPKIFSF